MRVTSPAEFQSFDWIVQRSGRWLAKGRGRSEAHEKVVRGTDGRVVEPRAGVLASWALGVWEPPHGV